MNTNGYVLSASTTVGGIALLPNTGGHSWLTYGAIIAITGGAIALVSQVMVTVYRRRSVSK